MTPHRRPGSNQRLWRWSLGMTLLFVVFIAAGILFWMHKEAWESLRRGVDMAAPLFALWRLLLFAILIGGWPLWTRRLAARYRWDTAHVDYVRRLRWSVAAGLILIELLMNPHLRKVLA